MITLGKRVINSEQLVRNTEYLLQRDNSFVKVRLDIFQTAMGYSWYSLVDVANGSAYLQENTKSQLLKGINLFEIDKQDKEQEERKMKITVKTTKHKIENGDWIFYKERSNFNWNIAIIKKLDYDAWQAIALHSCSVSSGHATFDGSRRSDKTAKSVHDLVRRFYEKWGIVKVVPSENIEIKANAE